MINFRRYRNSLLCLPSLMIFATWTTSYAQSKWGIRLNQNTDFFYVTYEEKTQSHQEAKVRFGRLSAAVSYVIAKNTHELELFVPQINASNPSFPLPQILYRKPEFKNSISSFAMRYSAFRSLSITNTLFFTLGGAFKPYYLKTESLPVVANFFSGSYTSVGFSLNVIPGVTLKPFKQVSFVLDCPLKIFDFYRRAFYVANPAIPVSMRTISSNTVCRLFHGSFYHSTGSIISIWQLRTEE